MKPSPRRRAFVVLVAAAMLAVTNTGCAIAAKEVRVATQTGDRICVATASLDPVVRRTAGWCRQFLANRGYRTSALSNNSDAARWILTDSLPDLLPDERSFLRRARGDAYVLRPGLENGRAVIVIGGRDARGVRSGVARLVSVLCEDAGRLTVPERVEMRQPFYMGRRLNLSYEWPSWDEDRVRRLLESAWLMGYNSVQFPYVRTGLRGKSEDEAERELARDKVTYRRFMRIAREYGLSVSQVVFGLSFYFYGRDEPGNIGALCWYSEDERKLIDKQFRWLAANFGDLVDDVTVHVSDPGGCDCDGCDPYITCQEVATALLQEYREVNPDVTVTLSTWAHPRFWGGHQGTRFLDESYMPSDIGMSLHRWYNRDLAAIVRSAGRPVDIWSWYLGDYEGEWDFFLNMSTIARYYEALPRQASREIRVMTQELCFPSRPQVINTYVAAQKMWNPKRDLNEIEREFCAAVYGDRNADAMVQVYRACERYVHPGRYDYFIPPTDCPPEVIGTADYNAQLRSALESARSVSLEGLPEPRIAPPTDRAELLERLLGHLHIIYAGSQALEDVADARKSGKPLTDLTAIVEKAMADAEPYKDQIDWMPSDFHIQWGNTSLSQRVKDSITAPLEPLHGEPDTPVSPCNLAAAPAQ